MFGWNGLSFMLRVMFVLPENSGLNAATIAVL
jgi:hypothetical protein